MTRSYTQQKERAFTLIELIIVIVVLGILSTIAIVGYQTVIDKSTEAKQVSRMTQVLKEAKVLYVQNIYSDPTYTWGQAIASAVGDLPTYTINSLTPWFEGVLASGGTDLNNNSNDWTLREDSTTTDVIYSAATNDIVMYTSPAGTVYVASAISASKGVFGMVSQTTAPFVWVAGCSGSTCDAATASSGPPAGSSYASGTTAVTTTGPTTTIAVTTTTTTPATTTVPGPACAAGGVCVVGNTGPGGGKVFYVQASGGTFPCGATLTATCRYLEAAPTSGTAAWTDAGYVWSGNTNTLIGAAAWGDAIGTGLKNTEAIVAQNNTAGRAGTITRAYRGPNNRTDWYLPSYYESDALCKWQRGQMMVQTCGTNWANGGLNTGTGASGFVAGYYWTSSESSAVGAYYQYFTYGYSYACTHACNNKSDTLYVRPVRAF